jgi:HTH-type transcriptional regulator/antitoxin HigA
MLKPITTKKEYDIAIARVYKLMQKDLKKGSKLSNELSALSVLVEAYEKQHYPLPRLNAGKTGSDK